MASVWHQQPMAFHGVGVKRTDGYMRQNCFLVDALARLALKWMTDRGLCRERPMCCGVREEKETSQVGPRRHSRHGSAGRDRDRDKVEQGQKSS